jgi:DNA-binding NarL/FixJ family response regulator
MGIAHDFKNMLTVILGYSSFLLADKNEGDPGYKGLQSIVKTSQDAADLSTKARDYHKGHISLVILDILMPRMDGKECLEELLRINPTVKVIISSGVGQEDLIQDVVKLGAKGAVNKPYGMRQLLGKVREVLDGD